MLDLKIANYILCVNYIVGPMGHVWKGSLENKITQKGVGPEEGLRHEYEGPVS